MPLIATAYCTIGDLQNRLSAAGVTSRTDDSPPDDYGDVIDEASRIVDEHAASRYGRNLGSSEIVKHWTANIAAFLLCERRGNPVPVGIASKYERAMKSLEAVLLYGRQIPDIAEIKGAVPVLTNVHTQLVPFPHTVAETGVRRSTGAAAGYTRNTDTLDGWNYEYQI